LSWDVFAYCIFPIVAKTNYLLLTTSDSQLRSLPNPPAKKKNESNYEHSFN
jgi:hypothetical protein